MDVKDALFDEIDMSDLLEGNKAARRVLGRDGAYDRAQYRHWRNHLVQLYLSSVKWYGLPAGVEPRTVEYVLALFGMGALFTEDGGYLFGQTSPGSALNINYSPNAVQITSPAGDSWTRHALTWVGSDMQVHAADCALCYDNLYRKPVMPDITYYAKRLATVDRVADVNVSAQLTPWIIAGSEAQDRNAKRLITKLQENSQYLVINDAMVTGGVPSVLATAAPFVADQLHEYKTNLLAEYLCSIGVDNDPHADKKANRNIAEIVQNNEQVMLARNARLAARRQFCERAHDVFGLDLWCEWAAPHIEEETQDAALVDDSSYAEESDEAGERGYTA